MDVVVIGAGFGGLAAALRLSERGARVVLCETLRYPGGCASTFARGGYRFEAGATLFSGLGEGQLFSEWNRKWNLGVRFEELDPVVELRAPGWSLRVPPDRAEFVERFTRLPGVEPERVKAFFATQRRVADPLWALFRDPSLLPPLSARALLRHLGRAGGYLPVARWMGRSLRAVAEHHGRRHYVSEVQDRMRDTVRAHASGLLEHATVQMTASPRTFERFTGRPEGYVGGVPRTVGFRHYRPRALWPREVGHGLYLVGDSVMFGQSTLAVALGGVRTAERIAQLA